jgi:hypothetical protein
MWITGNMEQRVVQMSAVIAISDTNSSFLGYKYSSKYFCIKSRYASLLHANKSYIIFKHHCVLCLFSSTKQMDYCRIIQVSLYLSLKKNFVAQHV